MNTFCIAASAWLGYREQAVALVDRFLAQTPDRSMSLLLDTATVLREPKLNSTLHELHVKEFDVREWVNETLTEGGVINVEMVRRQANMFDKEDIVVIRAVGFLPPLIHSMLTHLHAGLYSAATWPKAVAVICDDAQIYHVSPMLTQTFYVRPSVMIDLALDRLVRSVTRKATLERRFGIRLNKLQMFIQRCLDRIYAKEDKALAKKLGWKWEE